MSGTNNNSIDGISGNQIARQSCVRIIRRSNLPVILKAEVEKFIERNVLPDCGRVPPNCLKAFMIKTAQRMGFHRVVPYVKNLFRAKVGYEGYFLDSGQLFRVDLVEDIRKFS